MQTLKVHVAKPHDHAWVASTLYFFIRVVATDDAMVDFAMVPCFRCILYLNPLQSFGWDLFRFSPMGTSSYYVPAQGGGGVTEKQTKVREVECEGGQGEGVKRSENFADVLYGRSLLVARVSHDRPS